MAAPAAIDRSREDAAEVKAFFDQWAIYRRVRECGYLHHRAAYAAIDVALADLRAPFSLLDLGAGDAESTVEALNGKPVARYQAVDLSAVALELARKRASILPASQDFVQADFVAHVEAMREIFDVVLIGLSLHHLPLAQKRAFLPELRRVVAPGGRLLIYEPILALGESRDACLARWWNVVRATWNRLNPDELERTRAHVFGCDHPEEVATFAQLFAAAGFGSSRVLFTDPAGLYAVFEARA